jgi:hypothetical protein
LASIKEEGCKLSKKKKKCKKLKRASRDEVFEFQRENNFNLDGAKRWCFLPTSHMLTPHKKRKNCKNKFYTLPHETHTAEEETSRWSKKEEKEEKRRKKEGSRRRWVSTGSRRKDLVIALRHLMADPLATKTHGWVSPAVGLVFFFFFFLSV